MFAMRVLLRMDTTELLTLMLLLVNLAVTKNLENDRNPGTWPDGYSSGSTQQELSNKFQDDRVKMIFCFFVHWTKVTSAAERLRGHSWSTSTAM